MSEVSSFPEQPARLPDDPGVSVSQDGTHIFVMVGDKGLRMSPYNAWRVFGMLACVLGLPLSRTLKRGIKF